MCFHEFYSFMPILNKTSKRGAIRWRNLEDFVFFGVHCYGAAHRFKTKFLYVANIYEGGKESSVRLPKVMAMVQTTNINCLFHWVSLKFLISLAKALCNLLHTWRIWCNANIHSMEPILMSLITFQIKLVWT